MPEALLTTKLYAPLLRVHLVRRPRLVERLSQGLRDGHRLTLISAPAGYGKTTLVAEWRDSCGATPAPAFTWLSLDESDNDPVRFCAYLVMALRQVHHAIGATALAMTGTSPPPRLEVLLGSLINDLAAVPEPFILVLDDFHLIQAPPIHQQLGFLLEHQPPQMHLVLVTREDPPLPLARLRAREQVTEIRQRDLQFTEAETAAFLLRATALELPDADVALLQRRTEGWIAGLQLAALSMQHSDDPRRFLTELTGTNRYILDYLVEEVYQRQTSEVQDFLVKTSILDRLTAPLCDAVTGRDDGGAMLPALDRANLFILRLDESRQWYRYHRLFRDLLRTQRGTLDTAPLHLKASRWCEQNGFVDEAMGHALAAHAWDEAERLIRLAAPQAINNGQFATLNCWLDAMPEHCLRSSPELAVTKAWALLALGQFDATRAWVEVAESLLTPETPPLARAMVVCLQTYLAQIRSDYPKTIELAQRALRLLEGEDPHGLRGAALSNLASAQVAVDDVAAATRSYRELARVGQEGSHPISSVTALGSLAWLENLQGHAHEALALSHQALELSVDSQGNRLPLAGYAQIGLGLVYYDLDELALARQNLIQGLDQGNQLRPTSTAMQGGFALARVLVLLGDREAGLASVAEVRRTTAALNVPLMDASATAWDAEFQLWLGNVEPAVQWAETSGLSLAGRPNLVNEGAWLTQARVLLAQKQPAEALVWLARLEDYARGGGLVRSLITTRILQALAQDTLGEDQQAQACLAEAVRLAAPEGYRRAFLDDGPGVLVLLAAVRDAAPEFVDALLGVPSTSAGKARGEGGRPGPQPLIEPLSVRELEVLGLLAEGLTNQEIAGKLIIGLGTVKTHVHAICGKLTASNRTQAVARARELGIL